MKKKQILRFFIISISLAAFMSVSTAGCFGRFELTRKIYHFNQKIDNDKWIQWMAFLGLNLSPVYGFSLAIDVLFGNTVEFWTGKNPITSDAETTKVAYGPNGELVRLTRIDADTFSLDVVDVNLKYYSITMVHENNGVSAFTPQGQLIARIADIDGAPELFFNTGI